MSDEAPEFKSKLTQGRQRFLAQVVVNGFEVGRRTPEDFIRHFPPAAIMEALKDRPTLRANILCIATGVKSKIAIKKSAESAGVDLQIALDEGEVDAETIVSLFDPDDRVRYLDAKALWAFVVEGEFWRATSADKTRLAQARDHVAYIIDRALADQLLSHRDVVDGVSVQKLAELLPRSEIEKLLTAALDLGHNNKPFTAGNLWSVSTAEKIVQHIPLPMIWDNVVARHIAGAHGFVSEAKAPEPKPAIAAGSAASQRPPMPPTPKPPTKKKKKKKAKQDDAPSRPPSSRPPSGLFAGEEESTSQIPPKRHPAEDEALDEMLADLEGLPIEVEEPVPSASAVGREHPPFGADDDEEDDPPTIVGRNPLSKDT